MKEKLLGLGVFIDNEYLDLYCSLIEDNRQTKKEKFKTQQHHVIPCACYDSREEANKDPSNLKVNLLFKDHILAHCYLCLCAKDSQLKYKMIAAIEFILGKSKNITNQDIVAAMKDWLLNNEVFQNAYEEYAKIRFDRLRTPEVLERRSEALVGHTVSPETKRKISEANKGRKKTPEELAKLSSALEGRTAWNTGLSSPIANRKCIYDPTTLTIKYVISEQLPEFLASGWVIGNPTNHKGCAPSRAREVRCIDTGEVFNMIKTAAEATNISSSSIMQCLKGRSKTAGGFRWEYTSENLQATKSSERAKKAPRAAIRCVETNKEFATLADAGQFCGVTYTTIRRCCIGKTHTAGGYHWEYVEN